MRKVTVTTICIEVSKRQRYEAAGFKKQHSSWYSTPFSLSYIRIILNMKIPQDLRGTGLLELCVFGLLNAELSVAKHYTLTFTLKPRMAAKIIVVNSYPAGTCSCSHLAEPI